VIVAVLHGKIAQMQARAALAVAIAHLPRVEERLLATLLMLAEARGRATTEGLVVRLPLTHERLGQLVGARRPTVTLALRELDLRALVRRRDDAHWVISPAAADQLQFAMGNGGAGG
jgi:CRP-like cAMP-binding protein